MKYWWFRVILGLIYRTTIESFSLWFTRIRPTELLIAQIFIGDFRYEYCRSIPLTTVLGINLRVFGAKAVLV